MSEQPEEGAGSGSLFFELAGDLRLSMLTKLRQKQYRLSQIAMELDATLQESHRNMIRLIDSGLVSKDSEGDSSDSLWKDDCFTYSELRFSI